VRLYSLGVPVTGWNERQTMKRIIYSLLFTAVGLSFLGLSAALHAQGVQGSEPLIEIIADPGSDPNAVLEFYGGKPVIQPPVVAPAAAIEFSPAPDLQAPPVVESKPFVEAPHMPAPQGGHLYETMGPPNPPCSFDSYWDLTGGRSPTEWTCALAYGPECHAISYRLEWLLWFSRGRNLPVLARTTTAAGVTDEYPKDLIGEDPRNGARVSLAGLLPDGATWIEGRFWGVEDSAERLFVESERLPLLTRPFFNVATSVPSADVIAAPGFARGNLDILSKNDLFGLDVWLRHTWCESRYSRFDVLAGYQFTRMDDSVRIHSNSTLVAGSPLGAAGSVVDVTDVFGAENEFHGGVIGAVAELRHKCWSLEVLGKIAFGDLREAVAISGQTVTTQPGLPTSTLARGLLAQPSNSGTFEQHQFAVVPELNVNGIVNLSPNWRLLVGYSLIFWSDAVLAGEHIDVRVNPTQLPGPIVGRPSPIFAFHNSDYLVQGLNLGAEFRW
jgi:hypothetical protein